MSGDHRLALGVTLFGGGLALALVVELLVFFITDPELGRALLAATVAGLFLGREAGIPTGLALGVHPGLMWQMSSTLDLATGATGYGLVMLWVHRSDRRGAWIRRLMHEREREAAQQKGFLARWGRLGVFFFMLVPFMVNGVLVVGLASRLAGLHTRGLILPVLSATVAAAGLWVAFAATLLHLSADIQGGLDVAITGVFLGGMMAWAAWRVLQFRKHLKQQA